MRPFALGQAHELAAREAQGDLARERRDGEAAYQHRLLALQRDEAAAREQLALARQERDRGAQTLARAALVQEQRDDATASLRARCSRDAAEMQPRSSREAAERQPRGSREAATARGRGAEGYCPYRLWQAREEEVATLKADQVCCTHAARRYAAAQGRER